MVSPTPHDVQTALALETQQYLTAVDAMQIAVARKIGDDAVFVSSDEKLNRVARESGMSVVDPSEVESK